MASLSVNLLKLNILNSIKLNVVNQNLFLNKSRPCLCVFHRNIFEQFRKGGKKYHDYVDAQTDRLSELDKIQLGYKVLKNEFKWQWDRFRYYGDTSWSWEQYENLEEVIQWDFKKEEDRQNWRTVCDSDWGEGFSSVNYSVSNSGCALLTGNLDQRVPQDGQVKRGGFVFFGSEKARKPFFRTGYFDNWWEFSHFVIRCRGDGRTWNIILDTSGTYDIFWGDRHVYNLYTRGGPYWQWSKIPFSNFLLTHKQRVPDEQGNFHPCNVKQFGLRLSDRQSGPFKLEIDYIGVMNDENHILTNAYEHYEEPFGRRLRDLGEV